MGPRGALQGLRERSKKETEAETQQSQGARHSQWLQVGGRLFYLLSFCFQENF